MRFIDWFWKWMGYRKVWLEDFDGELNQRWAKPIRLKGIGEVMIAYRNDWSPLSLYPDGVVRGKNYVVKWHEEA